MDGSCNPFFGKLPALINRLTHAVRNAFPAAAAWAQVLQTVGLGQRAGILAAGAVFVGSVVRSLLASRRSGEQGEDGSEVVQ